MHVLVTGNQGYIGSMLTRFLIAEGYRVSGLDTGYYSGCEFDQHSYPECDQITKDIRLVDGADVSDIDAVIHLAALSNDPLGAFDAHITDDVNYRATVKLAQLCKNSGITRFVYASSCSQYGIATEDEVTETSPLMPVTAYAKSKADSEAALLKMADADFTPVFLRPATVCGVAPMLRCDIVLNNLVGWACTTGTIRIMSDGTPWRPVVHIEDLCRTFMACLEAPANQIRGEAFNVGETNYRIRDMADIIKTVVPGCVIEYTSEHGSDSRTYRVSFQKLHSHLPGLPAFEWDIEKSVVQLFRAYREHGLTVDEFLGNRYVRLNQLHHLIDLGTLNPDLYWKG